MAKGKIKLTELQQYKLKQAHCMAEEVQRELNDENPGADFKGEAEQAMETLDCAVLQLDAAKTIGTEEFCDAYEAAQPDEQETEDEGGDKEK